MARTNDNIAPHESRSLPILPLTALDQLARLHVETSEASRLTLFLRSSVHIASLFMLMGTCVFLMGGSASFAQNFSWAVLILVGVAALLISYIRNMAAAFDRAPISEAARNLRLILFYMGLAWGSGAFLALPAMSSVAQTVLFAVIPVLLLALMLKDVVGLCVFLVPAGAATIYAAFMRDWPGAPLDAVLISLLQGSLFLASLMRRRSHLPAGLALR